MPALKNTTNLSDFRIDTFSAGLGPCCVRIVHVPSGLRAEVMGTGGVTRCRRNAFGKLAIILAEHAAIDMQENTEWAFQLMEARSLALEEASGP